MIPYRSVSAGTLLDAIARYLKDEETKKTTGEASEHPRGTTALHRYCLESSSDKEAHSNSNVIFVLLVYSISLIALLSIVSSFLQIYSGMMPPIFVCLIIALVFIIISISCIYIKKSLEAKISYSSKCYKTIERLNRNISFEYPSTGYGFSYYCYSKTEFEKFDENIFFEKSLYDLQEDIIKTCTILNLNRKRWSYYTHHIELCPPTFPSGLLHTLEQRMCRDIMRHQPPIDGEARVEVIYISPAGKNRYQKTYVLAGGFEAILNCIDNAKTKAQERQERQETIAQERAKMTSSLRYDVMRRDGFKCVLCGSSASDGVKLEVDHIHPVSKGGRTVMSNLRTLCDRCNRGKRDKIEVQED